MIVLKDQAFANELQEKDLQPNAVDIRINSIWHLISDAEITDNGVKHADQRYVGYYDLNKLTWQLQAGKAYRFESTSVITVPPKHAGWLISRSSLNRSGLFVVSGLYDSGFNGRIGGTIYCFNQTILQHNTRIAQFVLVKAQQRHLYNGQYQNEGITKDDV